MPAAAARHPPPDRRAWGALALLTFVYVLNFLDRQLVSILAKPMQDELNLSDGQLGLLGGLYFALFYCFIALPIGWLADRTNRVAILSLACAIWSAATAACGLAQTYPQLVAARMAVGFGEAGGVPVSYALITDRFGPGYRGTALALYNLGPALGAALGVVLGATIAAAYGWRAAFIAFGAVGIVTALVLPFLMREPARGAADGGPVPGAEAKAPFWGTTRQFFAHPVLLRTALGSGATQFITYGLGNFAVLFLMREKGMALEDVALWYALAMAVGVVSGMIVSGRVIDRLLRRSRVAYALVPAVSLALALPLYLAFVWSPGWSLAVVLLTAVMFLNYFYLSSSIALVQEQVRPHERVLTGALLLLVVNLLGLGLGPTYVGAASDYFAARGYENSLQLALYTLAPVYAVAVTLFLSLASHLRRGEAAG